MELHRRAPGCHLPYRFTQCYLSPDTSKHTPTFILPARQTDRYTIYLLRRMVYLPTCLVVTHVTVVDGD